MRLYRKQTKASVTVCQLSSTKAGQSSIFGGWQTHIGFYATPSGNEAFRIALAPYQSAKGSVKFPLDQPMPYALIEQIAKYRLDEVK